MTDDIWLKFDKKIIKFITNFYMSEMDITIIYGTYETRKMDLRGINIVLLFISYSNAASSFKRILRTPLLDTVTALETYSNLRGCIECAKMCRSDCLSFSYEPDTKLCKTFPRKLCSSEAAAELTSTLVFIKGSGMPTKPADCGQIDALCYSGVYRITPSAGVSFDVFCDMDTPDGPWTVIQNRESGEVDFYRNWDDYKNGFGDLNGNFWLGNDAIHDLTTSAFVLRIDLVPWLGEARYAEYSTFSVENEADDYRLTVSGFSGTVFHDAMANHNGMRFSTFDDDNDVWSPGSCAVLRRAGWWYRSCYHANLNGAVYINGTEDLGSPIWDDLYKDDEWVAMMKTRMLVKRSQ